jgi:hypothetical protein
VSAEDTIAEIRRLYFDATPGTIERDLARAITLLKTLPTDEVRLRAAGYMDGLSQLRSEWRGRTPARQRARARPTSRPPAKG